MEWGFEYDEFRNKVFMPNEIFTDLKQLHPKGSSHVAFAYSYYYLISWLYRYAVHGEAKVDTKLIKRSLGYSVNSKEIDYIFKKNGFLDEIKYTESSTDFPVAWEFSEGELQFTMLSEMDKETQQYIKSSRGRNSKIKVPIKGLSRYDDNTLDGTFYDISNTHMIPFNLFHQCMINKKLGCSSFYLLAFMIWKCKMHNGKYNSSVERISKELGFSDSTTEKYIKVLKELKFLNYERNEVIYDKGDLRQMPNTYWIIEI